ncbi:hypothetical protein NPIL_12971 [Nephila pilipes]|uniref:Uncharacterized protein n=1 Tax=Nephila pilipes TaxID=299642 RepID=A0A8X6NC70_NEPPI|nr:hypothetical protein NPIL_12971 [Nephila pilipes]
MGLTAKKEISGWQPRLNPSLFLSLPSTKTLILDIVCVLEQKKDHVAGFTGMELPKFPDSLHTYRLRFDFWDSPMLLTRIIKISIWMGEFYQRETNKLP